MTVIEQQRQIAGSAINDWYDELHRKLNAGPDDVDWLRVFLESSADDDEQTTEGTNVDEAQFVAQANSTSELAKRLHVATSCNIPRYRSLPKWRWAHWAARSWFRFAVNHFRGAIWQSMRDANPVINEWAFCRFAEVNESWKQIDSRLHSEQERYSSEIINIDAEGVRTICDELRGIASSRNEWDKQYIGLGVLYLARDDPEYMKDCIETLNRRTSLLRMSIDLLFDRARNNPLDAKYFVDVVLDRTEKQLYDPRPYGADHAPAIVQEVERRFRTCSNPERQILLMILARCYWSEGCNRVLSEACNIDGLQEATLQFCKFGVSKVPKRGRGDHELIFRFASQIARSKNYSEDFRRAAVEVAYEAIYYEGYDSPLRPTLQRLLVDCLQDSCLASIAVDKILWIGEPDIFRTVLAQALDDKGRLQHLATKLLAKCEEAETVRGLLDGVNDVDIERSVSVFRLWLQHRTLNPLKLIADSITRCDSSEHTKIDALIDVLNEAYYHLSSETVMALIGVSQTSTKAYSRLEQLTPAAFHFN
ncbi:MAG: hypothetical protein H6822_31255 [Planctomycetaceae bacterium]|nr:hypothetical protein [Planctomycetaceae bacterium]